jgi:hypothetical protein
MLKPRENSEVIREKEATHRGHGDSTVTTMGKLSDQENSRRKSETNLFYRGHDGSESHYEKL